MSKVKKAIFPAAGLGTRFLPATKAQPKEMLPLVDKPLIQYAIEEATASGIEEALIITGRGKQSMENHFDTSYELEDVLRYRGQEDALELVQRTASLCAIAYTRQHEALGLGHAVRTARPWVHPGEPTAVVLADDIITGEVPCLKQLVDAHARVDATVIAAMEVPMDQTHRYGIFEVVPVPGEERLLEVKSMEEKPPPGTAPSNLAAIGRYVISWDVFEELEETEPGAGGEIQLTDAFRTLLARKPVYAYRFEGTRHDGGDKLGFLKATIQIALTRPQLAEGLREYLLGLDLENLELPSPQEE